MTSQRHPNVVHHDEVPAHEMHRGKHQLLLRRVGPAAGSQQLGATLTEVAPGAVSFPFHYHCGLEEAIYVLSGTGTARIGEARVAVRAGDWIAFPAGPDHAHQMINDSDAPLVYLCVSTHTSADVVGYPDSKKVAAIAGPDWNAPWIRRVFRDESSVDYWESEPNA